VIINGSKHLESGVVHHLNVVYCLDVVGYLVVHYSGVLDDLLKVDVILVAMPLVKAAVVIVSA
jgi:hypothetical protein